MVAIRRCAASFLNIGEFLVINVPLTVILGMTLAAVLAKLTRMKTFFRLVFFVPYVTASVAVVGGVVLPVQPRAGWSTRSSGRSRRHPSWLVNSKLAMLVIAL